ncbi:MAG: DUF1566 domain-containing protein [Syntrophobacteria bacterium]
MKTGVFRTDQVECYNSNGALIPCEGTGQDGAVRAGAKGVADLKCSGQQMCFNDSAEVIAQRNKGQDQAPQTGAARSELRFLDQGEIVLDTLTGLVWTRAAVCTMEPLSWQLALDAVKAMNAAQAWGCNDWRLPNIRELESLTDMCSHTPALPVDHPFDEVQEWYWSSTTSRYDPRYAWVLYTVDGAVGVGYKPRHSFFAWAVRLGRGCPQHSKR